MSIFIISFFYITGRYFAYSIVRINSVYTIKPLGTFIWIACQGLWVGITYYILQAGIKGKSAISQALYFGILIYGLNWLMNHAFIFLLTFSPDLFIRAGIDILFTIFGVFTCKKLFVRNY